MALNFKLQKEDDDVKSLDKGNIQDFILRMQQLSTTDDEEDVYNHFEIDLVMQTPELDSCGRRFVDVVKYIILEKMIDKRI